MIMLIRRSEVRLMNQVNYQHHDIVTCTVGSHLTHPLHLIRII